MSTRNTLLTTAFLSAALLQEAAAQDGNAPADSGGLPRAPGIPRGVDSRAVRAAPPFVAPRTPVEAHVAAALRESLQVERVGMRDNFCALGGHSLRATQVALRLEERLGTRVQPAMVLNSRTVEELSAALTRQLSAERRARP